MIPIISFLAKNINLISDLTPTPIEMVLKSNHQSLEILNLLIKNGASFIAQEIQFAIQSKNLELVKFIYETGRLNRSPEEWASLATKQGDLEIVKFLESKLITVPIDDWLENAILENRLEIVKFLIEKHFKDNSQISDQLVFLACGEGHLQIFDYLVIEKGVKFDVSESLMVSIQGGNLNILNYIFEKGMDLNQFDSEGHTALYNVSKMGNLSVVRWLVENGANINLENSNEGSEENPVWTAINCGNVEIAEYLVSKGADLSKQVHGENWFWMWDPIHLKSAKLLVDSGSFDVNRVDNAGETMLFVAVERAIFDVVKLLIDQGIDVNKRNENGKIALNSAAQGKSLSILKLLIDCGSDVNNRDLKNDSTPLRRAIESDRYENVKLLLASNKIEMSKKNIEENLRTAVFSQQFGILALLLDNGFDDLESMLSVWKWTPAIPQTTNEMRCLKKLIDEKTKQNQSKE